MWGWLSGIADWLKAIWEKITNIPEVIEDLKDTLHVVQMNIFSAVKDMGNALANGFQKIWDFQDWFNEKFPPLSEVIIDGILYIKDNLSAIGGFFESTWENITQGFTDLGELFKDRLEGLGTLVTNNVNNITSFFTEKWELLKDWIAGIPAAILDGIKAIFIPDAGYIQTKFDDFLADVKLKFGVDTDVFKNLFRGEKPVEDVKGDYYINGVGTLNLKFFDTSFFTDGVTYFRPLVRGFLVLLMLLYHVKQAIGFFGYDAGVVTGRSEHIASAKKAQGD